MNEGNDDVSVSDDQMTIEEILGEGRRLLEYVERNLGDSKLWQSFRYVCIQECLTCVEGLFDAIGSSDFTYKEYRRTWQADTTDVLIEYLKDCIEGWISYIELRGRRPALKLRKGALVYFAKDGRLLPLYFKRVYPRCSQCGEEMALDYYGNFYCPACDEDFQNEDSRDR